jgi:disulfide bond formation protein DsbB
VEGEVFPPTGAAAGTIFGFAGVALYNYNAKLECPRGGVGNCHRALTLPVIGRVESAEQAGTALGVSIAIVVAVIAFAWILWLWHEEAAQKRDKGNRR